MRLIKEEINALREFLSNHSLEHNPVLKNLYTKLSPEVEVDLFVDGAADLHSKTAGIGGIFYCNGEELYSYSEYLHDATNNEAEYHSLIAGIKIAHELNLKSLAIYADSELVVKQINGVYQVRNSRMKELYHQVTNELNTLTHWTISHIPREKNKRADALSKEGRQKGMKSFHGNERDKN